MYYRYWGLHKKSQNHKILGHAAKTRLISTEKKPEARPLKNDQFCLSSRQAKILTTDIHGVFRGLKSEPNAEIEQKGVFFKGLEFYCSAPANSCWNFSGSNNEGAILMARFRAGSARCHCPRSHSSSTMS